MGWWNATISGGISPLPTRRVWGDEPADVMGRALERIRELFVKQLGREPSPAELRAGLEFSLPSQE